MEKPDGETRKDEEQNKIRRTLETQVARMNARARAEKFVHRQDGVTLGIPRSEHGREL